MDILKRTEQRNLAADLTFRVAVPWELFCVPNTEVHNELELTFPCTAAHYQ